jgi:hypothetical protein
MSRAKTQELRRPIKIEEHVKKNVHINTRYRYYMTKLRAFD